MIARVLIVVPTLGTRLDYLRECLASIRDQDAPADMVVVCPAGSPARELAREFGASVVADPGSLPAAINAGAARAGEHHEFMNWLGDDDLLEPGSLTRATALLDDHPGAVVAYGACRYLDAGGEQIWVSSAGAWAARTLSWGPDLVPQPGLLIRRSAWERVGGVDPTLRLAFDLDLLLKLRRQGKLIHTPAVLASFRWHPDSLTASQRSRSLAESEAVKRRYYGPVQRNLRWLWEKPVRVATRLAAWEVQRRASYSLSKSAMRPTPSTKSSSPRA